MTYLAERSEVCALIEGPEWPDCEFYATWLRAAAAAEALWKQALKDEQFEEQVMLLWVEVYPNFKIGAFTLFVYCPHRRWGRLGRSMHRN